MLYPLLEPFEELEEPPPLEEDVQDRHAMQHPVKIMHANIIAHAMRKTPLKRSPTAPPRLRSACLMGVRRLQSLGTHPTAT